MTYGKRHRSSFIRAEETHIIRNRAPPLQQSPWESAPRIVIAPRWDLCQNVYMAQKRSSGSGCLVAIVLVIVLGIGGVVGVFFLFTAKVSRSHERAVGEATRIGMAAEVSEEGVVIFQRDSMPRFPPHKEGQALTREQFIVQSIDSNATDLMRAEFAKTANGTTVRWLLLTDDIRDQNNRIQGSFSIPYEIHRDHGMSGSSVSVTCSFQDASRDSLLKVRRGDWVLIQGKLSFDGSGRSARIEEAVLLDENTPPFAESP